MTIPEEMTLERERLHLTTLFLSDSLSLRENEDEEKFPVFVFLFGENIFSWKVYN
jgi:hypothetical protein